jgi:hypothetical protein
VLRGRGDLDEDDAADPFGVGEEEALKGLELWEDALGRVELVAANDDLLAAVELAQGGNLGRDA